MNEATTYFEQNIAKVSPASDPIAWNLNLGLKMLAQQVQEIQSAQIEIAKQVQRIQEMLSSRSQ